MVLARMLDASVSATPLAFLGTPGPMEMMIVGVIVLLLFGNRLPSVMRSLGIGITEFKRGIKGEGMTEPNTPIEDKRAAEERRD